MKVFARCKSLENNLIPFNYNIASALDGALQCGVECIQYIRLNEIIDDIEKGDIVLDGIDQINYVFNKFGINLQNCDYPEVLNKYLGRKVWKDTINHINSNSNLWGNFVKPIKEKAFTGKIINSTRDLIGCGSCYENYEVYVSEPVNFINEFRGFVYYDELIDMRPYSGSYKGINKLNTLVIEQAMKDFVEWKDRPNSCSLDWGITDKGDTLFIEMNYPYALGCYGLDSISYIKLISAFNSQVYALEDELDFRRFI